MPKLNLTRKKPAVVGLDIEAGSVAATEVTVNGSTELGETAIAPLDPGLTREGEVTEPEELGQALKSFFSEQRLARNVRLGIASQRVVVRTLRMPLIEKRQEIETAIRFQAAEQIPMPLDQAVLDWQVLESSPEVTLERQMDVAVVAARREAVTGLVHACRSAGLRPVGIDVSAFGMIRALGGEMAAEQPAAVPSYEERLEAASGEGTEATAVMATPARLLCNLGDVTNLAVAAGSRCLFTRVSTFGMEGIAQRVADRCSLSLEDARQWMLHVGLDRPVEEIDGDPEIVQATRKALDAGMEKLAGELRLSLDYYGSQEAAVAVEEVILCGHGSAVAGVPQRMEQELGYAMRVGRPQALAHLDDASAARLTLAYGLALEE